MIGKTNDLPRALPLIAPPRADELLSSWLTRIAQDYYIPPRSLLTHMGLSSLSFERLDLTLTFAQAIAMSGFVRQPPDAIIGMTHTKLPADCQTLVRVRRPQQACRSCAAELKRGGAAGAVLKSWMQAWRVTCRACGAGLADIWSDADGAGPTALGQFEDKSRAGEEIVDAYAARRQTFQVSPATILRLLLLRRRPTPQEIRDQPELPRRLIGTFIPEFDAIADEHGLNTAIGRSTVLPMIIRVRLLAGLVVVMKNPLDQLSRLRQSRAFGPQFDRVLAQNPILTG